MVLVPVQLRNIELEILDTCLMTYARNCKQITDYVQAVKIIDQLQGIAGNVTGINLDKQTCEYLILGFQQSVPRPENWVRARSLIEQICVPACIQVPDEKTEKEVEMKETEKCPL
jgi:hypothetical protein